ncbi:MAG TPA: hypothetical protein VM370_04325 [Candidatus Thermoplasmatota archaeon]|nr:hypothetical protein [Candidatus Thermoplasmatota archaeon]
MSSSPLPRASGVPPVPPTPTPQMQVLESALHDATNGIAAARSYGEILLLREKAGPNAPMIESLLKELERAGEILRNVRSGVIETYQPGDVLMCKSCGYTFVHRKAAGKMGSCRRCKSYEVTRWKP